MYSRRLEEYHLLNRLSRIDDIRQESSAKKQTEQNASIGKSIPEAMAVYMSSVVSSEGPLWVSRKQNTKTEQEKHANNQSMMEVVEVYRIANRRREDAREQLHGEKHAVRRKAEEETTSNYIEDELAYERLDCSRGESYLLYSYNAKGTHSLLGRDVKPGTYGGRITTGEFYRKA